jgi:HlyD family secretion protein
MDVNTTMTASNGASSGTATVALPAPRPKTAVAPTKRPRARLKAQTAKALVAVADTKRTLGRQIELFQRELVAAADRDTAQTAYDSAGAQHTSAEAHERAAASAIRTAEAQLRVQEAALQTARDQVKQKEAALAQAQINLDHTTIRSPVDGVVVNRAVDVGQTVAVALQAPTLFTIAQDLNKMQVETSVDEADIGRIHASTPVTFTVDAFPGETFTGAVSQLRKAPQVAQNVVTYTVVVAVANPAGKLLPGMTANVKFVTAHKANVLKVPNTALPYRPSDAAFSAADSTPHSTPDGAPDKRPGSAGSSVGRVWILGVDRHPVPLSVTLGVTDGIFTEVVQGDLEVGQAVLVGAESPVSPAPPTSPRGLRL